MKSLWIFEHNKILILRALMKCDNYLCGSDFINHLDIPKNLVSYHLKTLRERGFVNEQQQGRSKNYQLNPQKAQLVTSILHAIDMLEKQEG